MKKCSVIRACVVLFSFAALFFSVNSALASSPWPADATGTMIEAGAGYEPSGIIWHSRLSKFFVVSDNGYVISMDADGSNKTYWNVGGDLEAVTIADPNSNYIYIGIENPDSIKEFDVTTGQFTDKSWDLRQWMTGPDNSGLEALAFIPNGRNPYGTSSSGGLFYAGLQADGKIYVFDVDLMHSGTVTFKNITLVPAAGKWDISDMFYSFETDTIYAIFDSFDILVEMAPDGAIIGEYTLPQPYRGQEGVVVVPSSPGEPASIYIAQDEAPEVWKYDNFPVTHVMTLTVSSGSGGTTDPVPGSYLYDWETPVTITANPSAGYKFNGWSGALTGTANPAGITMDANKSITATFAPIPVTYTLSVTASNGTVAMSPAGGTYNAGTVVTLTATPAAGYKFNGWSGALTGMANPSALTMDASRSVTANFTVIPVITYKLTTSASNGSITLTPAGGTYNAGTVVTLKAVPKNFWYRFKGWSGAVTGTANPTTLTMNANKQVTATFKFLLW